MPLYTYRCPNGHITEELRKMGAANAPARCMSCRTMADPILSSPSAPRFRVEGVKGYYKKSTLELPNA